MSRETISDRLAKLRIIPEFARRDHREFTTEDGGNSIIDALPRKERRLLAKNSRRLSAQYISIMKSMEKDRVGFPIDTLLSSYGIEYTNRYACSGVYTQPTSFNYVEPFCDVNFIEKSIAPYARPLRSLNHIFSLSDFFDFITDPGTPEFEIDSLEGLPEAVVFNFTPSGLIGDITFKSHTEKEFSVAGFSLVRRGTSVNWMLLGGETLSQSEWDELVAAPPQNEVGDGVPKQKRKFVQEMIEQNGPSVGPPIALEGTTSTHRSVLSGEIDIPTGKILGRFCATEYEHAFTSICDDPELFDYLFDKSDRKARLDIMSEMIGALGVLWAVSESLIRLPQYISARITYNIDTEAGKKIKDRANPKGSNSGIFENIYIPSLERANKGEPTTSFVVPDYKIETEGYWKRLDIGKIGVDSHGKPVKGKTWAQGDVSWRDSAKVIKTVYIKSTISSALEKKKEWMQKAVEPINSNFTSSRGVLYVLRCVFMVDEVYKIGWTSGTAIDRAKELSRATGVPKAFDVVAVWESTSARELESNVHAVLNQYRVNDSREFFQISLDEIKRVVDFEIVRLPHH